MLKRLAAPTGEIADSSSNREGDTPDRIVRSAVLIHSGPNGKEATLQSMDGDVTFDDDRIKNIVQSQNELISKLALQYGGFDKMPMGAYPPILDQHADDSNDRIRGRVAGLLRFEVRSVPKVGDNVACAICDSMTFLGSDTVDQVIDGRIYHLSVGLDEATNTLSEVSCVIEPAAPGAMVFGKRKEKLKKGKPKMNLKLAKLKAFQGELKQLSQKVEGGKKRIELTKRTTNVSSRFSKLVADKKMTPAELKKVDVARLSKLAPEDFESLMHVYEARESVVKSGQQGSTSASNFSDIGTKNSEDREVARLKSAVKKSMKLSGTKFKDKEDEDEKHLEADDKKDDEKKLEASDEVSSPADGVDQQDDSGVKNEIESVMQMVEENSAQIARVASMVDAIIDEMQGGDESDDSDEKQDNETEMASDDKKDDDDDKEKKEDKKSEGDK